MRKQLTLFLISIFLISTLKSQDIRGGRIQAKSVGWNTYSITLTLYIDSATNVNRPSITLNYGDATSDTLFSSTNTLGGVILKKYVTTHTYSGPGYYDIFFLDSFRIAGIQNITNSASQGFKINYLLNTNQFGGPNNSATISNELINIGVSGNQFMMNPGAFDPDGDSLSYSLGNCYTTSNYYLPGTASVNPTSGTFTFSKDSSALHAFVYKISEWRKDLDGDYYLIGTSEVDFLTEIKSAVGIKEIEKSNLISIHPNPTSGIINLKSGREIKQIELVNTLGQKVLMTTAKSIDISDLNPGIYYLKITFENNEVGVKKIIRE